MELNDLVHHHQSTTTNNSYISNHPTLLFIYYYPFYLSFLLLFQRVLRHWYLSMIITDTGPSPTRGILVLFYDIETIILTVIIYTIGV